MGEFTFLQLIDEGPPKVGADAARSRGSFGVVKVAEDYFGAVAKDEALGLFVVRTNPRGWAYVEENRDCRVFEIGGMVASDHATVTREGG